MLISLHEQPDQWYVLEPGARGPRKQPQVEKGLRRYFGTLFFLAIRAIRQFDRNRQLALGDVILSDAEVAHSHVASYLRDVNRSDKLKSVSADFPTVRLAIANSVFAHSGAKPPFAIRWKAVDGPDKIFFFLKPEELPERFPNAVRKDGNHQRLRTVTASAIAPTTQTLSRRGRPWRSMIAARPRVFASCAAS